VGLHCLEPPYGMWRPSRVTILSPHLHRNMGRPCFSARRRSRDGQLTRDSPAMMRCPMTEMRTLERSL
jgi:hypothetical protein